MRLRTFTATTMPEALALVKAELGEDAIILSTEEKKDGVHITAAMDPDAAPAPAQKIPTTPNPRPPTRLPPQGDALRYDIQHALRFHNVPEFFISKMIAKLSDAALASILGTGRLNIANEKRHFLKLALEEICEHYFSFSPLPHTPHKLMLVGTPGIGKTLAIAKLATQYTLAKKKTAVITTDVNRAGGAEQLKSFTDILGISLSVCADKKSLASALKMVGSDTHLLIDTAGCNPYEESELATLAHYAELPGVHTALVMQAGMDAQETIDIAELFTALPLVRLIASRLDCTRRFGGLLAASAAHRLPFSLASDSPSVADNIAELDAKMLVQTLLKPL